MRIAVFGLGYVGSVTGACLARMGHRVYGVDVAPAKVQMINEGHSPIMEKGMERLVSRTVRAGLFSATVQPSEAMARADLSLVCVGTPSRPDGRADLEHVLHAIDEIGYSLRRAVRFHTVAVRSTVPPGTMEGEVIPLLERRAGKKAGKDFGVCFHPEFLREGSSIHDFFHPPKTVVGALNPRSARRLVRLWRSVRAPLFVTSLKVAEIVKYADNSFHALKVAFANEFGAICKSLGVDSHEVMRIFVADTKLNISPLYLKPGFAFGGPCLPKDLRAIVSTAAKSAVEVPLLSSVLSSNSRHLRRAIDLVLAAGGQKIAVLGLVFKSDTDDLRESPACSLVKELIAAKKQVKIFDPRVDPDRLFGANRAFLETILPELPTLLTKSPSEMLRWADVVVVAGNHPEFGEIIHRLRRGQVLVDLVRLPDSIRIGKTIVQGLC
ncbi:MAG: nucleotide sugar dehydrogenase [Terriglobia bacterium]